MIKDLIKSAIPKELLRRYQLSKSRNRDYKKWDADGRPIPAPDNVKYKILDLYRVKYKSKTLVETGTYLGGMIRSHTNHFLEIHTIELMEKYYLNAKEEFAKFKHIKCHFGESVDMLKKIVPDLQDNTIYWLDAHYSVDVFARGKSDCPALQELEIVFSNPHKPIILIDDARDFTGVGDYPTVDQVKNFIKSKRPDYSVEVLDDIIVAIPSKKK